MKIKIERKQDGEIVFFIDTEERKFEYESFDYLIEMIYKDDETIQYENEDDLKEYKELIQGIIEGARTQDYRQAVEKAKEVKEKLENAEKGNLMN